MNQWTRIALAAALMIGLLPGCGGKTESKGPELGPRPLSASAPVFTLAVHPLHNPGKLAKSYDPLIAYLNARLNGARLSLEASRDYANFEEKYRAQKTAFILPNPWQTIQAMKSGYHVVATAGEPQDFKGIFIVRKDSGLVNPADLKGKSVSYPSHTALAACIMPQYFLHHHGVNVNTDIENRFVGSQESSIMNVYLGLTAAGATWPPPWRAFQKDHPNEAKELQVLWETESLINNSVMARGDVPAEIVGQVRTLLLGLDGSPEGQVILKGMETARFLPATDANYAAVREFIDDFERDVRPVEQKQ